MELLTVTLSETITNESTIKNKKQNENIIMKSNTFRN
jgi:hypothetical protein